MFPGRSCCVFVCFPSLSFWAEFWISADCAWSQAVDIVPTLLPSLSCAFSLSRVLSLDHLPPLSSSPAAFKLQCMSASVWMPSRRWILCEYRCMYVHYLCVYVCVPTVWGQARGHGERKWPLAGCGSHPLPTIPTPPNAFPHRADKKGLQVEEYHAQCPKDPLFSVMSSHYQHMHDSTHAHVSTHPHRDMPNMGFSIRNYPCNTHTEETDFPEVPFRFHWEEGEAGRLTGQSCIGLVKSTPLAYVERWEWGVSWRDATERLTGSVKESSSMNSMSVSANVTIKNRRFPLYRTGQKYNPQSTNPILPF